MLELEADACYGRLHADSPRLRFEDTCVLYQMQQPVRTPARIVPTHPIVSSPLLDLLPVRALPLEGPPQRGLVEAPG
jgi:hypothetical protein